MDDVGANIVIQTILATCSKAAEAYRSGRLQNVKKRSESTKSLSFERMYPIQRIIALFLYGNK